MVHMEFILMKLKPSLAKSDDIIKKTKLNKKIIGIGESGLDFYYNYSDKKDQIKSFEEHIIASQKTQLPLIMQVEMQRQKL